MSRACVRVRACACSVRMCCVHVCMCVLHVREMKLCTHCMCACVSVHVAWMCCVCAPCLEDVCVRVCAYVCVRFTLSGEYFSARAQCASVFIRGVKGD